MAMINESLAISESAGDKKLEGLSRQEESVIGCRTVSELTFTLTIDNSRFVLNHNNGWTFFPVGTYKGIRLDVYIDHSGYLEAETVLVQEITLPWVEQQGTPQGNFPSVSGIREICNK